MENAYTGTSMNNYKSHAAWVVKEPSAAEDSNKLICYVNHMHKGVHNIEWVTYP